MSQASRALSEICVAGRLVTSTRATISAIQVTSSDGTLGRMSTQIGRSYKMPPASAPAT